MDTSIEQCGLEPISVSLRIWPYSQSHSQLRLWNCIKWVVDIGPSGGETSEPRASLWAWCLGDLAHSSPLSISVELAPGWLSYWGDTSKYNQLSPSPELLRVHFGPRPCLCLELPARCMCGHCWGAWRVSVATLVSCLLSQGSGPPRAISFPLFSIPVKCWWQPQGYRIPCQTTYLIFPLDASQLTRF